MTLTGMELVEAIREGKPDPPSGIESLGLTGSHQWLTEIAPGAATMRMPFSEAHLNLEGALICSWLIAVADQAMFFASNAACASGEMTRMRRLTYEVMDDITGGEVTFAARVAERKGDLMLCECQIINVEGREAARVAAQIEVFR